MKIKITIGLLFLALISHAQQKLSLEQSRTMAVEHNQNIQIAEAGLSSSEASYKLSKRSVLPQFDLKANYMYSNDPRGTSIPSFELPKLDYSPSGVLYPGGESTGENGTYNVSMDMSLPLYMGGKLSEAKKMSAIGKSIAQENLAYETAELIYSTDQQYWSLVALKERKILVERSVAFLGELVRDMKNRYEAELITKNEVLKTQVDLNDAKLSLIEVKDGIQLAKMALNKVIGNPILKEIEVIDSIISLPNKLSLAHVNEGMLANRPELRIMENQLRLANSQLKITKSDYLPQLVSFASYLYQNPNHLGLDEGEFTWNAGVSLSVPIFHWGERGLKLHEQKMEKKKTELNYDSTKELLLLEIQQASFKLQESLTRINLTRESLVQAEENLKLEKNRLDEGLITTTDLLNAQMQWQKSYADYIEAKANFMINESNYYKSIGELKIKNAES